MFKLPASLDMRYLSEQITLMGVISLVLAISFFLTLATVFLRALPVPPGPKPKFLSGNVHQFPQSQPWLRYAEWSQEHGKALSPTLHWGYLDVFCRSCRLLPYLRA